MPRYALGSTTAGAGTDILLTCPPHDTLVPVLRYLRVKTGSQEQYAYAMSPLGIGWTKSYMAGGDTSVSLNSTSVCDNPDGTARTIAADELVVLTTEHAGFHSTTVNSVPSGGDLTVTASSTFSWDEDTIDTFQGGSFELSDVNGNSSNPMRHCGIHVASLNIANGATVTDAKIRFYMNVSGTGASNTDWTAYIGEEDDADDPSLMIHIHDLLQTDTEDGTDFTTNQYYEFDVTSGLQTVVNRAGWVSGNSVNLYVKLDSINADEPSNSVAWDDVGDTNEPELVVTSSGGTSVNDAPSEDVPYGSLFYYCGSPTDAQHVKIRLPANQTTTLKDIWLPCGVPTQRGKLAPASGRGCPQAVLVTNDTSACVVEAAVWEYYDPATVQCEGLLRKPTGQSAKFFSPNVEV